MKQFGTAAILAGGKSTRMEFDKQEIIIDPLNNIKLIDEQIRTLKQEFDEILMITNTPALYQDSECTIVVDRISGKGPLGGFHAALEAGKSQYIYFIACDMPYICLDYIRYMKSEISQSGMDACVARQGSFLEPFNSFLSKRVFKQLEAFIAQDKKSIQDFVKNTNCHYIEKHFADEFCSGNDLYFNINTKDQLAHFLASRKGVI